MVFYFKLKWIHQLIVGKYLIPVTTSNEFDIGRMYDEKNHVFQTERANPGYGKQYIDERRQQSCPGMVGPLDDDKYYCRGKEYGYCDRRSGTCYCNKGYSGLSCDECTPSHIRVGSLCYPKKFCPNDCSFNGDCNFLTGLCSCYDYREGSDCSEKKCTKFHEYCVSCNDANCVGCIQRYSVNVVAALGQQCQSCTRFDPRCSNCNEVQCLDCVDLLLTSISRVGSRRPQDTELPPDEMERELSITVPLGSQQIDAFDEAEDYFLVEDDSVVPLNHSTLTCDQGLSLDSTYNCASMRTSHVVCGHYGVITFSSPTYEIHENESHVRLFIRRSGGGVGKVSITYDIQHITTDDRDLTPTAQYNSEQIIIFNPGEIQKSFLITINDDRVKENNEKFLVFLSDPTNGSSLGNQYRTVVTIIDDDDEKTCSSFSQVIPSSFYGRFSYLRSYAGKPSTFTIHSRNCLNQTMRVGGDYFTSILTEVNGDDMMNHNNAASLYKGIIVDQGDGIYVCTMNATKAGKYQMNVYQLIPEGLVGHYFNDAESFSPSSLDKVRIDSVINFTWGYGRITNYGTNLVSIRWEGFLKAAFSETYTFYADFDDDVRIWIDGSIFIDNWTNNVRIFNAVDYELNSSIYYHVLIEYRDRKASAKARLLWSSENTQRQIIPSSSLFYMEHINNSPFQYTVIAGDANAENSIVSGMGISEGTAGKKHYFWIDSKDTYGNSRGDFDAGFNGKPAFHDKDLATSRSIDGFYAVATLISDDGGGIGEDTLAASISYDFLNRRYEAWFRPTKSGIYSCNVTLSNDILAYNNISGGAHVFGSPFTINTSPDITFAMESQILGGYWENNVTCNKNFTCLEAEEGVAGLKKAFTIISKDVNRNFRGVGGDDWKIIIRSSSKKGSYAYGSIQDLNSGAYEAYFTPTVSGWNELSVSLNGLQHTSGSPVNIFVYPNIAYGPLCFVETDLKSKTFVATATNSFSVQLVDYHENQLFNQYETYVEAEIVNENIVSIGNIMFVDNGKFIVYVVPKKSRSNVLIIKVNGENMNGSPFEVEVVTGESSALSSTAMGKGLTSATAGVVAEFVVHYRDIEGNIELNDHDSLELAVKLKLLSFSNDKNGFDVDEIPIVIGQCTYQDDGKHVVKYNATVSGIYQLNVTLVESTISNILKQHIYGSPFLVSVSPTMTDPQRSLVTGRGTKEGTAGKSARIEILLRDSYDNFVVNQENYKLSIELITKKRHQQHWEISNDEYARGKQLRPNHKQKIFVTEHKDGIYIANYIPRISSEYEMRVRMEMPGGLIGTYFKAPDFDENHLLFERIDSIIDITFHDSGVTEKVKNDLNSFSVEWLGFVESSHSEEYLFGITCDENGRVSVFINDTEVLEWSSCAEYRRGSVIMKSLEKVKMRVRYSHTMAGNIKMVNAFISLTWSSPSIGNFVAIPSSNLYHERLVSSSIYKPLISPGKVFAPKSTAIGKSLKEAMAGSRNDFTIECRDEFGQAAEWGNLQFQGGANVFVFAQSVNKVEKNINFTVVDNKNGTYTIEYIPLSSGSYEIHIFVSNTTVNPDSIDLESVGNELQVKDSPFNLIVLPGETDVSMSHIEDRLDALRATSGKEKTLEFYSKDVYGNPRETGGDHLVAKVTSLNDGVSLFYCDIVDNKNGTYLIRFTPKMHSGTHHLHIAIMNDHKLLNGIMGSPLTLKIDPGDAFAPQTHLLSGATFVGESVWTFKTNSSNIRRFQIITKDEYGNPLLKGGEDFVIRIQGERAEPADSLRRVTYDNGDGIYQSAYHLSKAGTYEMYISLATNKGGLHGLLGKYYSNRYFSGKAAMTRVDEQIDFDWGYGTVIPNSAKDYISIHWSGYLKVPYTEVYFFELLINVDDSAKLLIEDSTVIDTKIASIGSFFCTGNMLHKVRIEYVEMDGAASITFLWSSRRTPRDKIPSSYLFSEVESIKGSPFEVVIY